ncbi:MAG: hypothetical protein M3R35_05140, partial [Candidatus Eremiobacteraeota bacterium]|nr:hypothetical protein [Candidatus Eremiobacteraeota bacterium]
MRAFAIVAVAVIAALFSLPAGAHVAPSMRSVLQAVFSVRDFSDVSISPHGDALAWVERSRPGGLSNPTMRSAIYVQRIGSPAVRLTAGDGKAFYDEGEPIWSPDGKHIAFFSDAASTGTPQIFLAPVYGSGVRRLTHLTGAAQAIRWAPDGAYIAMLYIAHPHRKSGALAAGARKVGVIGSVTDEQQLAIVNATSGAVREVTPANAYVYEYGWSPDSKRLAYTYAYGNGDNNWWIARLAASDLRGHHRDLLRPSFQINDPQWSPDGRSVAVIGGLMSDFGSVGGDVYLVDPASGKAR